MPSDTSSANRPPAASTTRPASDQIPTLEAQERRSGWRTIRKVVPYLWPEGQAWVKRRVVISLLMLLLAKFIAVATPFFYKAAVDMLAGDGSADQAWTLGMGAVGITVAYGVARALNVGFQQLRDAVFARVGGKRDEKRRGLNARFITISVDGALETRIIFRAIFLHIFGRAIF